MRHLAHSHPRALVLLAGLCAACDEVDQASDSDSEPGHEVGGSPVAGGSGSLLASVATLGDATDPAASEDCEPEAGFCGAGGEIVYDHPLQGVDAIDGLYPFVDFHRTAGGGTYALVEGGKSTAADEYVAFDAAVVELETRAMTQEEIDGAAAAEIEGAQFPLPSKIGKRLALAIEQTAELGGAEEPRALDIVVERPWKGSVNTRLQLAIAQGLIDTRSDREIVRQEIADGLAKETEEAIAPLVAFLHANNVSPEFVGDHISSIRAEIPLTLVEALA